MVRAINDIVDCVPPHHMLGMLITDLNLYRDLQRIKYLTNESNNIEYKEASEQLTPE